ncbi:MAG: 50S ribosomal protein L29 [Acidimicrobiia bacterium]|jgi:large subunit ribosomal protein L29|nr:50S ribosomal protein L29 [Acidimicrobiia bacterium]
MAKAKKLAELSDADLLTRLEETSEELFNLRFQNATGQLTNVRRLSAVRRDKARVLTELRAREIAAAEALEAEEVAS